MRGIPQVLAVITLTACLAVTIPAQAQFGMLKDKVKKKPEQEVDRSDSQEGEANNRRLCWSSCRRYLPPRSTHG